MKASELYLVMRAIVRVFADSDRTDEIHIVEEITSRRIFKRWLETRSAELEDLMERRPELASDRVDYEALRRLPETTLGGAYMKHLDANGLSADSQATRTRYCDDPDLSYLVRRFRQTHDVWHALTGLGVQGHEEVIIHAFSLGQLHLPVSYLVVIFGTLKHIVLEKRWPALQKGLREAYDAGRDAAPLMPVVWEDQWSEPLEQVRTRFGVRPCDPEFVTA